MNDSLAFGFIGNLAVNYYDGSNTAGSIQRIDEIWYNANVWIAQRYYYKTGLLGGIYYRYATLILQNIVY